jgi:hypothetical protein
MSQEYTQEKFESDLKELGLMLDNEMKGGKSKKSSSGKKLVKKVSSKKVSSGKKLVKRSSSGKKLVKRSSSGKKLVKRSSSGKKLVKKVSSKKGGQGNLNKHLMGLFNESNEDIQNQYEHVKRRVLNKSNQNGGLNIKSEYRHFKISQLNGKDVDFGSAEIKKDRTPLSAAKKLLKSIAHHMGLFANDKSKLMVTFKIRETTRGHAKEYGPYHGKYHKYSANELKDAMTKGGKIAFKMKPVVKKIKQKGNAKREEVRNAKIMNKKLKNMQKGGK